MSVLERTVDAAEELVRFGERRLETIPEPRSCVPRRTRFWGRSVRIPSAGGEAPPGTSWGPAYSASLYMPGNEARWKPISQLPPAF